jgi:diguanylate cyclase (GGDEF)-like protein
MGYRTLFLFDVVSLSVYALALTILSFRHRRMNWLGWFATSVLLQLAATAVEGTVGDSRIAWTVLLPSLLNSTGFYCMYMGFRWLLLREAPRTQIGPMLLYLALTLYVALYLVHAPNAFAIGMAPVFISSGISVGYLLKMGKGNITLAARIAAGVLFTYMCVIIYRLLLVSGAGPAIAADMTDRRSLYSMLAMMLLGGCLILTYLWFFVAEMYGDLAQTARLDPLTGVLNRRAIEAEASREISRARRTGSPMALIEIDIDHFKKVNDTHGHRAGDNALRALVKVLNQELREVDMIGRFGGEEFIVLLPDTTAVVGAGVAERLREVVEATPVPTPKSEINMTISIGVTQLLPMDPDWEPMLDRADEALYAAKHEGRNRVMIDTRSIAMQLPPSKLFASIQGGLGKK